MDLICTSEWLIVFKLTFQLVGSVNNVKPASTLLDTIHKVACISETVCLLQFTEAIDDSFVDCAGEVTTIRVVNLSISLRLVVLKVTLDDHAISVEELAEARSDIEVPRALVKLFSVVALTIGNLSLAMAFSIVELTGVLCAIFVEASTQACNFTILELSNVLTSISHQKNTLAYR